LGRRNYFESIHTPTKVALRTVKCSATTSKDFGFKIAGMKVFQHPNDRVIVRQKAWGNQLKRKEAVQAIEMYLHNGNRTRVDVIPQILSKLNVLVAALEAQKTFSFVASSVLLIYEGDCTHTAMDHPVDLRLIDFDHTVVHPDCSAKDIADAVFGLRSISCVLKRILFREKMSRSETLLVNPSSRASSFKTTPEEWDTETVSETEPAMFSTKLLPNNNDHDIM